MQNNRISIYCAGLLASYSYLSYQIYTANKIIYDPLAWSNWQREKSLEEFSAIRQSRLENEILHAFQHRFIDINNPTDFICSFVQPSISLQKEIETLQLQTPRYQMIAASKSLRLFFVKADSLAILQEKHKNLYSLSMFLYRGELVTK